MRNIAGTSVDGCRGYAHGTTETLLWFDLQVQDYTVQVQEMRVQGVEWGRDLALTDLDSQAVWIFRIPSCRRSLRSSSRSASASGGRGGPTSRPESVIPSLITTVVYPGRLPRRSKTGIASRSTTSAAAFSWPDAQQLHDS